MSYIYELHLHNLIQSLDLRVEIISGSYIILTYDDITNKEKYNDIVEVVTKGSREMGKTKAEKLFNHVHVPSIFLPFEPQVLFLDESSENMLKDCMEKFVKIYMILANHALSALEPGAEWIWTHEVDEDGSIVITCCQKG